MRASHSRGSITSKWQGRYGPLSLKDQSELAPGCDPRTDVDDCVPIITTHVSGQGIMDCGHCEMTFQSQTVKVPLKRWTLMSILVNEDSTLTMWLDDKVVVRGTSNWPFRVIERWYMGFYGEGNARQKVYNDDIKAFEVAGLQEAEGIVRQELAP